MKNRCNNANHPYYKAYGGRGIAICEEWSKSFLCFEKWALANGYEESLELDRRDNDKGYSPTNCRFVTHKENCNNRHNSPKNKKEF